MAYIKNITFAHVGRNEGCLCDRCGQYIQNIVTVHYTDSITINYGQDCFEKLCKDSKLNAFGQKVMNKALKSIKQHEAAFEMWKGLTEEEAEAKGVIECLKPRDPERPWNDSYWNGKSFAEYKEWMITVWFPERFKEDQKEIDRFAKVNFQR